MFAAASRYLVRRSELASSSVRRFASIKDQFEEYGKMVFTGKVAEEYLSKHGSSSELLNDPTWVNHSSDTVAEAVFDWYVSIDLLACCCFVVQCLSVVSSNAKQKHHQNSLYVLDDLTQGHRQWSQRLHPLVSTNG
jgi:hypothetical protein